MVLSSSSNRKEKIKSFGEGFQKLKSLLDTIPAEAVNYRQHSDEWSINEIVIHLADNEAAAYINFRRAVAEPTETIFAFDKDLWSEELSYYSDSGKPALKLFSILRKYNYHLLKNLEEHVWLNNINSPELGQISLEDLLDEYEKHLKKALDEIKGNVEAWKKSK